MVQYIYYSQEVKKLTKKLTRSLGSIYGRQVQIPLDHSLAKKMINTEDDHEVSQLFDTYRNEPLTSNTLAHITNRYSSDVATLYFMLKSYQAEANRWAQDQYYSFYDQLLLRAKIRELDLLKTYHIAFIPGFGYIDDTTTGADFARQRKLLNDFGMSTELIDIGEYDLVDNNSLVVADAIRELCKKHDKIILVSASKGGLETAIALGIHLKDEDLGSIKAWISAGGILRGSPLADDALRIPKRWIVAVYLKLKGGSLDTIKDMSYIRRTKEYQDLSLPKHLLKVHYVALPLASKIHKEIRRRWKSMIKRFGPNDGLTPVADEITDDGLIVCELGLNHYFRDPDIDKKTFAMALMVVQKLSK